MTFHGRSIIFPCIMNGGSGCTVGIFLKVGRSVKIVWLGLKLHGIRGPGWLNFRRGLKAVSSETAMSSWKLHRAASNSSEKVV